MDAVIRVFKRVAGLSESAGEAELSGAAGVALCSIRLLVASTQAINLIGKQGSLIKSIQESTAASVRVLSGEEVPFYAAADERIIEMQGETLKYTAPVSQERQPDPWADKSLLHTATQTGGGTNYPLTATRESLFLSHESQLESQLPSSGLSIYGQEASLSSIHSSRLGRPGAPIVTQGLGLQVVKYLAAKYEELGCEVKWMGKPDKVI
ncbi:RNA-binding KH domain-containing protein PEPPER isoform X2 [Rosa chinensis]|uniref:RNA-binding KH domain-containing protein PEPPER isoform X2 n=1 Tax=Rosa chinensis TaxID=74649 RepID=UPI000D08897C|nr:RNA-binding KH domain-containing protein PEPPER isoform X2 [Rosa chinensis]